MHKSQKALGNQGPFLFITSLKTKTKEVFGYCIKLVPLIKLSAMSERSHNLLQIRPQIPSAKVVPLMSSDEQFQNKTIRPVLKLQNDLLLAAFQNYITKHKNSYYGLGLEQKLAYIENAIQKDIKFRNALKGIIIGQFTVEEYATYITNSSALNKRMMYMVIERLKNQLQVFEEPALVQ